MLYKNEKLKEIAFPIGGIGTGCLSLAGDGSIVDFEIFNRPNKGDVRHNTFFAIKAEYPDGKKICKVLRGDTVRNLMGTHSRSYGYGFGLSSGTLFGFPHFKKTKFEGNFPIARLILEDDCFPAKVILKAFNPFIPLDADNSSIPAAFFDVEVISHEENIKYTVLFSTYNPFKKTLNKKVNSDKYTAIFMKNPDLSEDDKDYGDITIAVDSKDGIYQENWYRGIWNDALTTFWYDFTEGKFENRKYDNEGWADTSSLGYSKILGKKEKENFKFLFSWNVPNNYNYWDPVKDENGEDVLWKNYYAKLFKNSLETAFYCLENWRSLYNKTYQFCKSIHSSTLDKSVIDAISSTISVLKSPTVLRLEDGTLYGFEGVDEHSGSCEGTCTHVWSYTYALCFLFPELERSLRDTEFRYDTDKSGQMAFRTRLPIGRKHSEYFPCVDGQMATLIKIYRDLKITGNIKWVKDNWDTIKKVLEFALSSKNKFEWDLDCDGVLEGRQHHTLDMELFGPSSWLEGMYLAALKSGAYLALAVGDKKSYEKYTAIFNKGYKWTKENLFNGKYFIQKIDLKDKKKLEHFDSLKYWNEEKQQIKYQIGEGSALDQMLGQWHANIIGLGDIFDKDQRKTALVNLFKNNFKPSLQDHVNMWRIFAVNSEAGSLICTYPKGSKKPVIPLPYCDECMTGFEYAFAGLLISEGFTDEGIKVVRSIRERYDGEKRNPFNEIECGSNYARAMSSFALLPIFSGFEFDLTENFLGFSPVIKGDFKCFFSLGTGWGDFIKVCGKRKILIKYGYLNLSSVKFGGIGKVKNVFADGKRIPFKQKGDSIFFDLICINKELKLEGEN